MSIPLGVNIPIRIGKSGYFDQSFDDTSVAKNNLIMLIGTKPGERRMNPEFGSSLWEFLFENITDSNSNIVEDIIRKDVNRWLPELIIRSVELSKKEENANIYTINLKILFQTNKYDKNIQSLIFESQIKTL